MVVLMSDESGDLGFDFSKSKTSRFFIISLIIVTDKKQVANTVKRVFRAMAKAKIRRASGVLHAHYEDDATRKRLLKTLSTKDIGIAVMRLDKHKLVLGRDPHILYSGMVIKLINQLFIDGYLDPSEGFELIASQADTNRLHQENFVAIVNERTASLNLEINIAKPLEEKGLQAADFVSWAHWQKYEHENPEYADIVKDKVLAEYDFL
jgi:hypothetical protein